MAARRLTLSLDGFEGAFVIRWRRADCFLTASWSIGAEAREGDIWLRGREQGAAQSTTLLRRGPWLIGSLPPFSGLQDLKDFARQAGTVVYADVDRRNPGIGSVRPLCTDRSLPQLTSRADSNIEYATRADAEEALARLSNTEIRGEIVTVEEDVRPLSHACRRRACTNAKWVQPAGMAPRDSGGPPPPRGGGYDRGYDDRGYDRRPSYRDDYDRRDSRRGDDYGRRDDYGGSSRGGRGDDDYRRRSVSPPPRRRSPSPRRDRDRD